jgi:hypothetical protein
MDAQVDRAIALQLIEHLVGSAERLHRIERIEAILAGQEIADGAGAVGQSPEDGRPVGHALVSGDAELGVEFRYGSDAEFRHGLVRKLG